jgi:hypothetical protein
MDRHEKKTVYFRNRQNADIMKFEEKISFILWNRSNSLCGNSKKKNSFLHHNSYSESKTCKNKRGNQRFLYHRISSFIFGNVLWILRLSTISFPTVTFFLTERMCSCHGQWQHNKIYLYPPHLMVDKLLKQSRYIGNLLWNLWLKCLKPWGSLASSDMSSVEAISQRLNATLSPEMAPYLIVKW